MPNAGLPVLGHDGATYPLTPDRTRRRPRHVHPRARARAWSAAAAARRRRTCARSSSGCAAARHAAPSAPGAGRRVAVPDRAVPPGHLVSRRRRAHQRQRLAGVPRCDARGPASTTASRWPATQIRDGSHLLDVCVDYVGRDGVDDMREIASRFATASTLPIMLDSTEPPGHRGRARMPRRPVRHQLGQLRGRRRADVAVRRASCRSCASTAPRSSP